MNYCPKEFPDYREGKCVQKDKDNQYSEYQGDAKDLTEKKAGFQRMKRSTKINDCPENMESAFENKASDIKCVPKHGYAYSKDGTKAVKIEGTD